MVFSFKTGNNTPYAVLVVLLKLYTHSQSRALGKVRWMWLPLPAVLFRYRSSGLVHTGRIASTSHLKLSRVGEREDRANMKYTWCSASTYRKGAGIFTIHVLTSGVLICTFLLLTVLFCPLLIFTVLICTLLIYDGAVLFCTLLIITVVICTLLIITVLICTLLVITVLICILLISIPFPVTRHDVKRNTT